MNYYQRYSDITVDMQNNSVEIHKMQTEPWKVTILYTGQNTMTGGRIKKAQQYIGNERFLLTYGDGISDVNILETIDKSCKNLTIDSISFNQETGAISLTVTASKVNGCEETVRTLRESGTFKTVDYNGYTQDGGVSETTETVTDPTTGATTTQTVTNTTPITYKSSITCTLEGGTTSGQD